MSTVINLRAHHLLCTVLYRGKGYSEKFTANMDRVTEKLKKPDTKVSILTTPDAICSACPNRKPDGGCALDDENKPAKDRSPVQVNVTDEEVITQQQNKNISSLDQAVLTQFKISTDRIYTSEDLFTLADAYITPEFFDAACGNCRWCKLGLCSYNEYKNSITELI